MIKGKALLVITRLHEDDEDRRYDVSAYIQKCSGEYHHRDAAQEEFEHLKWDVHPVPNQAYRLQLGETIRVHVVFEIHYHQAYDGEIDSVLYYNKAQSRRRQQPRSFYRGKT